MTRDRSILLSSLQSRFVAVYLIVMAPIAVLASYYQYTIQSDRHQAREIAALDAVESAFAPVTSTLIQADLLLDLLSELTSRGLPGGGECDRVIDAILQANFPIEAVGIYNMDGQPLCAQAMQRSGVATDVASPPVAQSPRVTMTDSDILATNMVADHIVAIRAKIPKVDLPDVATGYMFVSRTPDTAMGSDRAVYQDLGNLLAPNARDILSGRSDRDVAVLPVSAFDLRLIATLAPGVAAPPFWLTVVYAGFVPLLFLTLSLLLADLLIRKMALNDITRLTRDMRAFRQDRNLPKVGLSRWATDETTAMQAEFSVLSDQLLHEEAEAQNRLHNANTLQREIFHRVGNNLQIIQSILRLYESDANTPEERQLVHRLAARIRVINLVHNAMHRSVDAPVLPVGQVVSKLIQGMRHEGIVSANIEFEETYQNVELRLNRAYALCYLLVEKLTRLSRSGARHIQISLLEDGDQANLSISADVGHLAQPDPVSARLRQVYTHDLHAIAQWHEDTNSVTYKAVMPRQVK
ncbi:Two-component sensor histidine kinase, contains HisKA and HATPase domains [Aliiroseovarius sediminilitoris]|uniref:histidine kinase n=1 Tax=Aliiroseovarius sediminilitoris TaxID=1173584 RepID=A0A1I0Q9N2_9RHOB|nr:histidine kinase dimerization/phosphoacceptor domain -containing protein [Aliiroseovarius sediminilitoris]SEW23721.1 Two-component sensor histidine kinase, contains HisKA and HATPase domains [Aliiroseovarius sediminilitoris]